jgi:hypothetical protein
MMQQTRKQNLVWGVLLIVFGLLAVVENYTDLSVWVWVAVLVAAGAVALGLYLADRSEWGLLITAYVLWAVAGLVALIELEILQDEFIATYVLAAIALPFLALFVRDRAQWWALIPAYVLLAVGVMVGLIGEDFLQDEFIATYILAAIALPFLVVFVRDRAQWWALIPAYVLLAVGVMVGLIGAGVLDELLIPAYVMFAIAIPFLVVYGRDSKQWWALIPGGIMAVIGLAFLVAEAQADYIVPAILILIGIWMLVRMFIPGKPAVD